MVKGPQQSSLIFQRLWSLRPEELSKHQQVLSGQTESINESKKFSRLILNMHEWNHFMLGQEKKMEQWVMLAKQLVCTARAWHISDLRNRLFSMISALPLKRRCQSCNNCRMEIKGYICDPAKLCLRSLDAD